MQLANENLVVKIVHQTMLVLVLHDEVPESADLLVGTKPPVLPGLLLRDPVHADVPINDVITTMEVTAALVGKVDH